jgi:hypothetical protein
MIDSLVYDCMIAFAGGAIYEAGCVGWVHFSEKGRAIPTALLSMVCAAAQVAGIGTSVKSIWAAPFFIVGYGVGTYCAVILKSKIK